MSPEEVDRTLRRVALEIVEAAGGARDLGLVGVRRGGVPLVARIARIVREVEDVEVPVGEVDITLYRDDAATALPNPRIGPSDVPFEVEGRDVVLVDDVLQTGRTVRAAIECLMDYGRPRRIWLAALCDRGGRELPIAADFVGRTLEVDPSERLELVEEGDALRVVRGGTTG
jgi:pyrimidine operon attenuation protein/uracil phosphoribosyltransferase